MREAKARKNDLELRKKTLSEKAQTIATLQKTVLAAMTAATGQIAEMEKTTKAVEENMKFADEYFAAKKFDKARQTWLDAISTLEQIQSETPTLPRVEQMIACFIGLIKCSAHTKTGDDPESYLDKIRDVTAGTDHESMAYMNYYAGRFKELFATAEDACKAAHEAQAGENVQAVADAFPKLSLNA
jgi:outer membrane protein assembly factor BamD (BamD/ComL family)